jgi:hypothetical protein
VEERRRDEADVVERVRCAACGREISEDEAQAQRWGYWVRFGELYPYCPECAQRELGSP